jgi:hypothetical protein
VRRPLPWCEMGYCPPSRCRQRIALRGPPGVYCLHMDRPSTVPRAHLGTVRATYNYALKVPFLVID